MTNYLKLLSFIRDYKRLFAGAVAAMFFSSFFRMFEMSLLVPLIDRIFNNRQIVVPNKLPAFLSGVVDQLNAISPDVMFRFLPFVVLIGMLIKHVLIYTYNFLMNDISQRIMRDVRQRLYVKIQNFSLDYFSKKRTGELMSRITNDVNVIDNAVSYGVTDLFVQTFSIIGFLVMAMTIHFKACLILLLALPAIIWPINQIGRKLRKLSRNTQERMADINSLLLETIGGIKVVKAFCSEAREIERFRRTNHDFYKLRMKSTRRLLLLPPITELFGAVCGILMIFWLGRQVMGGSLSFGVFMLFFASIMSVISPIKKLGNVAALTQQALAANERIYEILDRQPTVREKAGASDLSVIRHSIVLRGVDFHYDEESGPVLHGIDLEIKAGQVVAIVGPTGTGKSTLVNLIPRFYDPTAGTISIDDVDVREVSFASLRRQIGIVAQETFLFNDTVEANIAYGRPEASRTEVESAARKAYAHDFIKAMPQGYDTRLGDRGFRLSGGEKQRISIARAILSNPPILILDEATSQLDSESERFVQDALDALMKGRTVVAIAHRLSTIKKADKIVVLEKGRVVGMGPHQELLTTCDLYRRLYETQFQA